MLNLALRCAMSLLETDEAFYLMLQMSLLLREAIHLRYLGLNLVQKVQIVQLQRV
jgi:hypothetical protein